MCHVCTCMHDLGAQSVLVYNARRERDALRLELEGLQTTLADLDRREKRIKADLDKVTHDVSSITHSVILLVFGYMFYRTAFIYKAVRSTSLSRQRLFEPSSERDVA